MEIKDKVVRDFINKKRIRNCPEEIAKILYAGKDIPYTIWIKYGKPIKSKSIFCEINCIRCNSITRKSTKSLNKRKLVLDEICANCAGKECYCMEHWRTANSNSQKLIQSTPAQKLKNSEGVSRFWENNPDKKEKMRQKLIKFYQNTENKDRVIDAQKRSFNNKSLIGKYLFRNKNWIEFHSAYELCFLMWIENKEEYEAIRRPNFYINYNHENRIKRYYPDYLLIYKSKKILVEIKSIKFHFYDNTKNEAKIEATKIFLNISNIDDYWFLNEENAKLIGLIFKRSSGIRKICKKLFVENKLELFSKEKHEKYIGISQVK